jgi:tight adherence protein B
MGLLLLLFAFTFALVLACVGGGLYFFKAKQKHQIRSMLRSAEASAAEQRTSQLLRPADNEGGLALFLSRFKLMGRLDMLLSQAGMDWPPSKLVTLSAGLALLGAVAGLKLHFFLNVELAVLCGVLAGMAAPLLWVLRQRSKAIKAFEEQFPEALDFLSRSMRAGHGFTVALEMLAADAPDPLGAAFRGVSNDLQLGSSLDVALNKIGVLVPTVDVRFFISSVLLQQETGGNLGEILTKLAHIIRERFRLKGQVKAVSAHGRITGLVLLLMPVAVTFFMMFSTPKYLTDFAADPTGRALIYGAISGQIVGYFVIKKIINIRV